jgi:hypothetical protein
VTLLGLAACDYDSIGRIPTNDLRPPSPNRRRRGYRRDAKSVPRRRQGPQEERMHSVDVQRRYTGTAGASRTSRSRCSAVRLLARLRSSTRRSNRPQLDRRCGAMRCRRFWCGSPGDLRARRLARSADFGDLGAPLADSRRLGPPNYIPQTMKSGSLRRTANGPVNILNSADLGIRLPAASRSPCPLSVPLRAGQNCSPCAAVRVAIPGAVLAGHQESHRRSRSVP